MRYLTLFEVLELHRRIIASTGGSHGIRNLAGLEAALAQPRLTFDQADLYPDVVTKAAAICFSIIMNHPFVDGNKRVGHASMETFLVLNGYQIQADVDQQERVILHLAAGKINRHEFASWLNDHIVRL
jgi:death on curing protein